MEELKAQIKKESSRAAKLSKEAMAAFTTRDFATGKTLMRQAVDAGRNCKNLIEQYKQTCKKLSKG
jgi:phage shock protein A